MRESAGILLFRRVPGGLEVLIAHPGGPLWARRDRGAWSIPKGLVERGEDPYAAARREFIEETGFALPDAEPMALGSVTLASGKKVTAWALEGDADPQHLESNPVEMTWPRGSDRWITFPEIDRVMWAGPREAVDRLNPAQGAFVRRLAARLETQNAP